MQTTINLGDQSFYATCQATRPANTTAYTAGDVVGETAAALTFLSSSLVSSNKVITDKFVTASQPSSCRAMITDVSLRIDVSTVPSGMSSFRLHLYNATPPSALADNAAWDLPSGDRASYIGYVDIDTPVDVGSTLFVQNAAVNKLISLGDSNQLYGYLVTNGAYTPGSADVATLTIAGVVM